MTMLGVERRWFMLSATVGLGIWNAINSIMTAAALFSILYIAGVIAWKRDPDMLSIIAASASSRARYDAGKPSSWHLHIIE